MKHKGADLQATHHGMKLVRLREGRVLESSKAVFPDAAITRSPHIIPGLRMRIPDPKVP